MTSFSNVFGGGQIQPSDVSYAAVTIASNTTLSWPLNNQDDSNVAASLMDVTASGSGLTLTMPAANEVSVGQAAIIRNIGSNTFILADNDGNTIVSIATNQVWLVYIVDNSSVAGIWRVFQYGTGSSTADALSLAGLGLVAIGSVLNESHPVTTKSSNYTLVAGDRAQTIVWTGGAGTFSLTAAATLGNNWFALIKNGGSGALTIDPAGAELIDGAATATLNPNDSAIVVCSGTAFYTIGKGQALTQSFTRLVKSVAGSADITLTAAEAANDVQDYTGILTGNINVIVPTAVGRWYVYNQTTGSFTLKVKTAAGTGVFITQGTRTIVYCDGTNVVSAIDTASGTVTSIVAGTGLSGGTITATGTIAIANTGVTAASYIAANVTVNAQGQLTTAANGTIPENTQSVDYTLVLTDANKCVTLTGSTGKTFTIPPVASVAFPTGTTVAFSQDGTGTLTIAAGAGVTIKSEVGLKLNTQYALASAFYVGGDVWRLGGSLKA